MDTQRPNWEQRTIERIALEGIKEQKRARRWGIFFKFLFFIYISFIIASFFVKGKDSPTYDVLGQKSHLLTDEHIALIRLDGVIAADKEANAQSFNATLSKAMSDDKVKGVLLLANSPGGSPVQSSQMYQTILAVKEKYQKPILTSVTDVCASGCYYVVSASDAIYADESSIVGSIGVISQSIGYAEAAKKLGLDPRTFTAGDNKDFMNPARPLTEEEVQFLKDLLNDMHQSFVRAVKNGRGQRLSTQAEVFSGLFWVGDKAKNLGLIDDFATTLEVAKKIGDYPVYDYMPKSPLEKALKTIGLQTQHVVSDGLQQALFPGQSIQFK